MPEPIVESVQPAVVTAPESTPGNVTEPVSSPEVKMAEPVAPIVEKPVVGEKANRDEQINNLNKALAIEREENKRIKEKFDSIEPVFDKMRSAFVPEPEVTTPEVKTEEQKFEEWYAQKEATKQTELDTQKLQETFKTQIENMSKEWDWTEWKPKYDDNEVYKWQKENRKEYLTPEEAFFTMKRDDLIDFKAKQALSKAPSAVHSEQASGISTEHTPSITKPKTDQEIKNAVLEALSSVE